MEELNLIEEKVHNCIDVITCTKQKFDAAKVRRLQPVGFPSEKVTKINFYDGEAALLGGIQRVGKMLELMLSEIDDVRKTIVRDGKMEEVQLSSICEEQGQVQMATICKTTEERVISSSAKTSFPTFGHGNQSGSNVPTGEAGFKKEDPKRFDKLDMIWTGKIEKPEVRFDKNKGVCSPESVKDFTNSISSSTFFDLCCESNTDENKAENAIETGELNAATENRDLCSSARNQSVKKISETALSNPDNNAKSNNVSVDGASNVSKKPTENVQSHNFPPLAPTNFGAAKQKPEGKIKQYNGRVGRTTKDKEAVGKNTKKSTKLRDADLDLLEKVNDFRQKTNEMSSQLTSLSLPQVSNKKMTENLTLPLSFQPNFNERAAKRVSQISTKELLESESDDDQEILIELASMGSIMKEFMSRVDVLTKDKAMKKKPESAKSKKKSCTSIKKL